MAFLFLFYFSFLYFGGVFHETIIPPSLVGYDMIKVNSVICTSLAISYHLISSAPPRGIIVAYRAWKSVSGFYMSEKNASTIHMLISKQRETAFILSSYFMLSAMITNSAR